MPRNRILLRGKAEEVRGVATGSAITPGALVAMSGTGDGWALAGAAAELSPLAVARELPELEGADFDDAIAQNSDFVVLICPAGVKINALSTDTLVRGDQVECGANGTVVLRTSGPLVGTCAGPQADGRVEIWLGGATA